MKGRMSDVFHGSIQWTKTVLFRPFNYKKWLILGLIALISGNVNPGFNFNFPTPPTGRQEAQTEQSLEDWASQQEAVTGAITSQAQQAAKGIVKPAAVIAVIISILVFLLVILIMLLLFWLYSRFTFVFLENIIKNDASIKKPFADNKKQGNSYFLWNITVGFGFLLLIGLLAGGVSFHLYKLGVFQPNAQISPGNIFLLAIPYALCMLALFIFYGALYFITYDFAIPIMFKEKIKIIEAVKISINLIKNNLKDVVLFLLMRAGLAIATGIIGGIVGLLVLIALLIPIGIVGLIFFLIFRILPAFLRPIFIGLSVIIGIPAFIALTFLVHCALLPISVFNRTLSLKFLPRLDEKYNFWAQLVS